LIFIDPYGSFMPENKSGNIFYIAASLQCADELHKRPLTFSLNAEVGFCTLKYFNGKEGKSASAEDNGRRGNLPYSFNDAVDIVGKNKRDPDMQVIDIPLRYPDIVGIKSLQERFKIFQCRNHIDDFYPMGSALKRGGEVGHPERKNRVRSRALIVCYKYNSFAHRKALLVPNPAFAKNYVKRFLATYDFRVLYYRRFFRIDFHARCFQ
jgi:hypothetical protein